MEDLSGLSDMPSAQRALKVYDSSASKLRDEEEARTPVSFDSTEWWIPRID